MLYHLQPAIFRASLIPIGLAAVVCNAIIQKTHKHLLVTDRSERPLGLKMICLDSINTAMIVRRPAAFNHCHVSHLADL